jgi:hypothetical protein
MRDLRTKNRDREGTGPGRVRRVWTIAGLSALVFILGLSVSAVVQATDENFSYFPCPFKEDKPHGKWGYIDRTGKVVIKPAYSGAFTFREGLGLVIVDQGKMGFIDVDGKMLIAPTFDDVTDFHDGMARFAVGAGGGQAKIGYVGRSGRTVPPNFVTGHQFSDGLAAVSPDGKKWGFIDKTGKFVIEPSIDESSWGQVFHCSKSLKKCNSLVPVSSGVSA